MEQEGLRHYKGFEDGRFRIRGSYELAAIEGEEDSGCIYSLFGQLIPAMCPKCKISSLVLLNILY